MSLTNKDLLNLVKESKKDLKKLTHISSKKNLSVEDKMKISLCKHFVRHLNSHRMTLTQLSADLKIPKSRLSEIVNYKLEKYSLEKLIKNIQKLAAISPQTREYICFVCEAFDIPPLKVKETKALTKKIKDVQALGGDSRFLQHA